MERCLIVFVIKKQWWYLDDRMPISITGTFPVPLLISPPCYLLYLPLYTKQSSRVKSATKRASFSFLYGKALYFQVTKERHISMKIQVLTENTFLSPVLFPLLFLAFNFYRQSKVG